MMKNDVPRLLFANEFHEFNYPHVLSETATSNWKSRKEWVTHDGLPDFIHLKRHFGNAVAPIADCSVKHYNAQQKEDMLLSDYISYWMALIADNYNFDKHRNLYLKDWHFMKKFPDNDCYQIPECFSSDWLNEFWAQRQDEHDDYRFVYMGPKGSWTPLHVDVFTSYSWSANICGMKKWILFPPEEEENLKDNLENLAYDVTSPVMLDKSKFPNYHKIRLRYEVLQKPGEVIFIPSKWLHQVHNMEDTISINHNWFNGSNIDIIWKSLSQMLKKVENEISDCRGMEGWSEQCQMILKATHGMDYKEFDDLLLTIAKSRLAKLEWHTASGSTAPTEETEIIYDLEKLNQTLRCMVHERVGKGVEEVAALQEIIKNAIDNYYLMKNKS